MDHRRLENPTHGLNAPRPTPTPLRVKLKIQHDLAVGHRSYDSGDFVFPLSRRCVATLVGEPLATGNWYEVEFCGYIGSLSPRPSVSLLVHLDVQADLVVGKLANGRFVFVICKKGAEELVGQRLKVRRDYVVEIAGRLIRSR